MRVTFEVGSYNTRRYSPPWIAKVTAWSIGELPTFKFGAKVSAHMAEIDANPGDLVRYGQKDTRGHGTTKQWGIVQDDGSIEAVAPATAREHWLASARRELLIR